MKFVLAVLVLFGLVGVGTAQHHHGGHGGHGGHHRPGMDQHPPHGVKPIAPVHKGMHHDNRYHLKHGHKFRHGYYYRGWNHRHWQTWRWHSQHRCWIYFDGGCNCWYYWCSPHYCFYPISYCPCGTFEFPYQAEPQQPQNVPEPPLCRRD